MKVRDNVGMWWIMLVFSEKCWCILPCKLVGLISMRGSGYYYVPYRQDPINPKPLCPFTHYVLWVSRYWSANRSTELPMSQYIPTASSDQIFFYLGYFCTSIKVHPACPCPFCHTVVLHAEILIKMHGARLNTPPTLNNTRNPEARQWDSNGWS